MSYEQSVSLHQQDGGITVQAFAEQHGIALHQMRQHIKKGRVIGARQDSRSKKWTIYPPAKLVDDSYRQQRKAVPIAQAREDAGFDVGTSPHGLSVDLRQPVQETREELSLAPPAKPVLVLSGEAAKRSFNAFEEPPGAKRGRTAEGDEHAAAAAPDVYTSAETKRIRRVLQDAAARVHREGTHYLRLDSGEFSQLYAALDRERSRIRKLVGKGLVDLGNLRASDSVWQKLQAMCHEGRLL